ncbi:MAG: ABC transporter ATP-binding protein [Thermoprotei archaeon]
MSKYDNIIEMKNIVKIYSGGVIALRGVDFSVRHGEIHGLLGENGAGKTTLMNILFGKIAPTQGTIYIRNKLIRFNSPRDAMREGIGMVHQHFMLIPTFTALDNIILGYEPIKSGIVLDRKDVYTKLEDLMINTGLKVDLDAIVESLPIGVRQRIEILKLLYRGVDIIILDEPTSVLTPLETRELFKFLRQLKAQGKTIIFISHKLKEALEITDRITVLRKGRVVGVVETNNITAEKLAIMMVGHEILRPSNKRVSNNMEPVLKVEDLYVSNDQGEIMVKGVSFTINSGEIFGIAGIEGNGQSELVEAITGLRSSLKGDIYLKGEKITGYHPTKLYEMGLAHIPEDRHKRGLILDLPFNENSILGLQAKFSNKFGLLQAQQINKWAKKIAEEFNIDVSNLKILAKHLSGGMQQKLIVGRELMKNPSVIIASQPTRGLDIAATEYIRNLLIEMRNQGKAILLVSADLDEVLSLSDRMAIMYNGQFLDIVNPNEITEEKLGLLMGGIKR